MTYIVTDACIKCKFMDCVEVCPVDCFYEGENFLAINPDECIDCGVCEPECPVDAIKPDTEDDPDGKWLRINTDYAKIWPNISVKGTAPEDAADFDAWLRLRAHQAAAYVGAKVAVSYNGARCATTARGAAHQGGRRATRRARAARQMRARTPTPRGARSQRRAATRRRRWRCDRRRGRGRESSTA